MNYIIGIDEAGRGPWAGPIVVGGLLVRADLSDDLIRLLPGLTDSKKLSEIKREALFSTIEYLHTHNECQYTFSYRDAHDIDSLGIKEANRLCMQDVIFSFLVGLTDSDTVSILIDGCDNFSFEDIDAEYSLAQKKCSTKRKNQEKLVQSPTSRISIEYSIGGDITKPPISAASIVAKVIRDKMMRDFSVEYPEYGFSEHKGYGTRKHQDMLLHYGISPIHRKSYAPVKSLILPSS